MKQLTNQKQVLTNQKPVLTNQKPVLTNEKLVLPEPRENKVRHIFVQALINLSVVQAVKEEKIEHDFDYLQTYNKTKYFRL